MNTKVLVLGHAEHGKSLFAKLLRISYQDSSRFALESFLYPRLNSMRISDGLKPYTSFDEAYQDRHNFRSFWYDQICEYNKDDPARLAKALLSEYDCYVGMRSDDEYQASKHLFDRIFWVDASERKPMEPETSMSIKYSPDEMEMIDNNGTEDELFDIAMYARGLL